MTGTFPDSEIAPTAWVAADPIPAGEPLVANAAQALTAAGRPLMINVEPDAVWTPDP
jgi:hypothetical protein